MEPHLYNKKKNLWYTILLNSTTRGYLRADPFKSPFLIAKAVLPIIDSEEYRNAIKKVIQSDSLNNLFGMVGLVTIHQLICVHFHQIQHS